MRLIRLLLLRSFRSRPARALLSMFGIILGVAGMLAISITNQSALDALTRLFADTSGRSRLAVISAGSGGEALPEQILRSAARLPGVKYAVPVIKTATTLASEVAPDEVGLSFFGFSAGGMVLYGIDPQLELEARDYRLTAGRFLQFDADENEIVLVETFAEDKDIQVGQRIGLVTPNGIERLRVVGLITKEGPGLTNNGVFGVAPLRTIQRMFNRSAELDQVDLVVTDEYGSAARLETLRRDLQARLGSQVSVIYPASQGQRMTQMLNNYQIGLNFLSGIALFIGAFLIYNAFAMTVVERTREFGMLRTVGMTRAQITGQVLSEAAILGVFGSALGVGLGVLLSRGLSRLMSGLLSIDLAQMRIPIEAVIGSFLLGLGVTLLGALLPARSAGKISPIAALRIRGQGGDSWLIRHGWKPGILMLIVSTAILFWNPFAYDPQFRLGSLTVFLLFLSVTLILPASIPIWERTTRPALKGVYGASGALGSRNIQRAKLRTTLTVGALLVGVAMILVVQGMTGAFVADLRVWLKAYLGGDVYVNSAVPLRSDLGRQLEAVPGVAAAAPLRYFPVDWQPPQGELETINFMAIDPAVHGKVTGFVFSDEQTDTAQALGRLAKGDAVFVSSVLSEKYGLRTGDSVILRTRSGLRDFEIAAVVVDFYNNGLMVTGNWNDMRRYFRINDANTFLVSVQPGADPTVVKENIDRKLGKRYKLVMELNESLRSRAFGLLDQAFFMFDVLAVISILVASLGVVNTLTMNVLERTREIGMLRAIGFTRGQVVRMILAEAGLMGLVGGALGIVFGILLTRIFLFGMTAMSGYKLTYVLPVRGIVVGLVVAVLISQLAALLPAMRAAKTRILEAIQYE